jgi:hypothetical protein
MLSLANSPASSVLLSIAQPASDNGIRLGAQNLTQDAHALSLSEWKESDWNELLGMAASHGMRPLLCHYLSDVCAEAVPRQLLEGLHEFTQWNLRKNLWMTGEMVLLLKLFAEREVNVIPFKGPTLAALAYGDLGLREFGDLDLLIDRRDLMNAQELLISQGYQPEMLLNTAQAAIFAEACNVMAYWNSEKEISVELHWELSPKYLPYSPDFDRLYQRLIPVCPGGQPAMTLAPEDLLLYLCAHGAKHAWARLCWIADVGYLIHKHPGLDWGEITRAATEQRCMRTLLLGVRLARDLMGVPVSPETEEFMRTDPECARLAMKVREWLFPVPESGRNPAAQSLFIIRLQQRWSDKARALLNLATTPSIADWSSFQLPQKFASLYPILRPLRLMNKLVRGSR